MDEDILEDLKESARLEKKILKVLSGHRDYIIMTALTHVTAELVVYLQPRSRAESLESLMDRCDDQLRVAVHGLVESERERAEGQRRKFDA